MTLSEVLYLYRMNASLARNLWEDYLRTMGLLLAAWSLSPNVTPLLTLEATKSLDMPSSCMREPRCALRIVVM